MYDIDDELHLYRAVIVDNVKAGDDRLQVRILPWQAEIVGEEEENLPRFPPFIKGQVVRGYTEKNPGPEGTPTSIWVLSNVDFNYGFVLGPVNEFNGAINGALTTSWNYKETKSILTAAGAMPNGFLYEDCEIKTNEANTFIEISSYKSPFKVMMTDKGTMFVMKETEVFIMSRAGTQPGDQASYIKMTPSKIECKAKVFDLSKSDAVVLGHHGLSALGTFSDAPVPCEGVNLTPCGKIKL
jgi:hypothetical protein